MCKHFRIFFGLGLTFINLLVVCHAGCIQYKTELSRGSLATNISTGAAAASFQTPDKTKTVANLISSLLSPEKSVRASPKQELVRLAELSSENRGIVIQSLLEHTRMQDQLDGTRTVLEPELFGYWSSVTEIFWRLKAVEAIDTMIKCIHCSNGYTGRMGEPPALYALVRMGEVSIPKLSAALRYDTNPYKRVQIALCLSRIGGPRAMRVLKRSARHEKDVGVRREIYFFLSKMTQR